MPLTTPRACCASPKGDEIELAEWIFANTAPALVLAEHANDFPEAVVIARDCVNSGRFKSFLEQLRENA